MNKYFILYYITNHIQIYKYLIDNNEIIDNNNNKINNTILSTNDTQKPILTTTENEIPTEVINKIDPIQTYTIYTKV